jgi:hypothetical protein
MQSKTGETYKNRKKQKKTDRNRLKQKKTYEVIRRI